MKMRLEKNPMSMATTWRISAVALFLRLLRVLPYWGSLNMP
jgi:hypothetical protein